MTDKRATRRQWLRWAGALALVGGGFLFSRFRLALKRAERRITGQSATIETAWGTLEYAVAGSGPAVMMIHGTGGGFDQGLGFGHALCQRGHRIIAPSRFGYLRSDFPADPSLVNQADALVALLDHLGIDRIPVIGGSAGALSASAFALRHPERCTALVLLVPAANLTGSDPVEMTAAGEFAVQALLGSDFVYWSVLAAAPEQLVGTLLATDPKLLAKVSPGERQRAFSIASDIMPVRARAKGMLNDARQAGQPACLDYSALVVPLLVISARDDRFGTAETARIMASRVPGSELIILPDGGHIWLGHDAFVAERIDAFLRRHRSGMG